MSLENLRGKTDHLRINYRFFLTGFILGAAFLASPAVGLALSVAAVLWLLVT
jgi:hypothetical protein